MPNTAFYTLMVAGGIPPGRVPDAILGLISIVLGVIALSLRYNQRELSVAGISVAIILVIVALFVVPKEW